MGAMGAGAVGAAPTAGAQTPGMLSVESNVVTSVNDLPTPPGGNTDFNSIDLLIALLLMAAMQGDDDEKSKSSSAMQFLAGLAMADALGRMDFSFSFEGTAPIEGASGSVGGQLNVTA